MPLPGWDSGRVYYTGPGSGHAAALPAAWSGPVLRPGGLCWLGCPVTFILGYISDFLKAGKGQVIR